LRFPRELLQHARDPETLRVEDLLCRGASIMQLSFAGASDRRPWSSSIAIDFENQPRLICDAQQRDSWWTYLDSLPANEDNLRIRTQEFSHAALYRFRADQVAASAYSDKIGVSVAEDGALTAVVLADIKLANDGGFDRIEGELRRIVPTLDRLRIGPALLQHSSSSGLVRGSRLYFDFKGADNVPAHHASQGTLVVLALLTVLHGPRPPSLILLDDFDHSLHPRAQIELVRMIKELLALDEFRDTQIIATTHSPYVLDEVSPSDVIAFALRDDGSVAARPLSEHPDAPKVNGSLKAGELWTLDAERDWVR
jgi:hypothetical protein